MDRKCQPVSGKYLERPYGVTYRSLFKSMGYSDYDLDRPLIGIANSWNTSTPGHYNLNRVSEYVKQGIYQAGGTPVEFGVIGPCDSMGCGNDGMHYCLPARDVIANEVEIMARVTHVDGLVLLGSCDKIVPGLLMSAARLDLPAILVNGGPMLGGIEFDGRASDNASPVEAYAMLQKGEITQEEYGLLEDGCMPCPGSCSFLGTANTMCCIAEALGMCIPGGAMVPAIYAERLRIAQESGRCIVNMIHENLTARKIINKKSLENAIRLGMAIGGSTNMALHIPAIAYEAECDEINLDAMDRIAAETPHLARIYPAGNKNVPDFYNAGGVLGVMKQLQPLVDTEALTCTGAAWKEILEKIPAQENDIIHTIQNAWHPFGSIRVLHGNLAPDGSVTKPTAIDGGMQVFAGKAMCFNCEEDATEAVLHHKIKPGTVLVIRYEGPKGGPGMREMVRIMKLLYGQRLNLCTALVTDGRFSGSNNGCFVGHVSPEAAEGGPIAVVEDGDSIVIDIPNGNLTLSVPEEEIARRMAVWKKPEKPSPQGYLNVYARLAESASRGAIIRNR